MSPRIPYWIDLKIEEERRLGWLTHFWWVSPQEEEAETSLRRWGIFQPKEGLKRLYFFKKWYESLESSNSNNMRFLVTLAGEKKIRTIIFQAYMSRDCFWEKNTFKVILMVSKLSNNQTDNKVLWYWTIFWWSNYVLISSILFLKLYIWTCKINVPKTMHKNKKCKKNNKVLVWWVLAALRKKLTIVITTGWGTHTGSGSGTE